MSNGRLDIIRARLMAVREKYRVHIGCMSEVTTPAVGMYFCQGCQRSLAVHEFVMPDDAALYYLGDVSFLLDELDGQKPGEVGHDIARAKEDAHTAALQMVLDWCDAWAGEGHTLCHLPCLSKRLRGEMR